MKLLDFIENKFPNGFNYIDATNLCMALYTCHDLFPESISREEFTMEKLATIFSELANLKMINNYSSDLAVIYGSNYHDIHDKGHWIEVLASILKNGNSPDIDLAQKLMKE